MENYDDNIIVHRFYEFATGSKFEIFQPHRMNPFNNFVLSQVHQGYGERNAANDFIYFAYNQLALLPEPIDSKVLIPTEHFPDKLSETQNKKFLNTIRVMKDSWSSAARTIDPDWNLKVQDILDRFDSTEPIKLSVPDWDWMSNPSES